MGNRKAPVDNIENLDMQKLVQLQVEQIEKQKREMNDRLQIIAKRLDHTERAFRKEERPLLEQDYIRQQEEDRITFYKTQEETRKRLRQQFEEELASKARLGRMMPDYLALRAEVEGEKRKEFEARREAAEKKRLEERRKRWEEVLRAREEEHKERKEEERRTREEEARLMREEEEHERKEEARRREQEEKAAAAAAIKAHRAEEREREIAANRSRACSGGTPSYLPHGWCFAFACCSPRCRRCTPSCRRASRCLEAEVPCPDRWCCYSASRDPVALSFRCAVAVRPSCQQRHGVGARWSSSPETCSPFCATAGASCPCARSGCIPGGTRPTYATTTCGSPCSTSSYSRTYLKRYGPTGEYSGGRRRIYDRSEAET